MDKIVLQSNAKINLGLDLLNKREDGYHEIRSIFQEVDWGDEISLSLTGAGINFSANVEALSNKNNLCYKAADLMMSRMNCGIDIQLIKNIPWGAGLGGGSSNAASVIMGINRLCKLGLKDSEMAEIGAILGSDVPFFIYGKTAHIGGRGERVTPIRNQSPFNRVLIVVPDIHLSTKMMYGKTKKILTRGKKSFILYPSFAEHLLLSGMSGLKNDFEEIAIQEYPELEDIKSDLIDTGCKLSMMTGSGSAFFGLYKDEIKLSERLKKYRIIQTKLVI